MKTKRKHLRKYLKKLKSRLERIDLKDKAKIVDIYLKGLI